jgi:hypothetical protein
MIAFMVAFTTIDDFAARCLLDGLAHARAMCAASHGRPQ